MLRPPFCHICEQAAFIHSINTTGPLSLSFSVISFVQTKLAILRLKLLTVILDLISLLVMYLTYEL